MTGPSSKKIGAGRSRTGPVRDWSGRFGRAALIGIPLAVLVVWTLTPIVWAVLASLKEPLEIYESLSLIHI